MPQQKLVFIGGGHSHAIALKMFGENPLPNVHLTLISDVEHTPYSGMLPGYVAGFYSYEECHIDLRSLCQYAQTDLIVDRAIGLDLKNHQVFCKNHSPIGFDLLSIDIGSTPASLCIPGAKEYAIAVKPVPNFLNHWHQIIAKSNRAKIGIVGGGAGGVELALNMHSRLSQTFDCTGKMPIPQENSISSISCGVGVSPASNINSPASIEIHLFHRDQQLMGNHNPWVRRHMQKILTRRGIQLHLPEKVCQVQPKLIQCESGLTVEFDYLFWVTQASAPDWPKLSGLATDNSGFILVNDTLQSISHPHIFAAGDIVTIVNNSCPKAGVFAVRQGKPLFHNLQQTLLKKPLKPYQPQKRYLSLIGTGNKRAVASWGSFGWDSPLLWYWKDWIDRQFMTQFNNLPEIKK